MGLTLGAAATLCRPIIPETAVDRLSAFLTCSLVKDFAFKNPHRLGESAARSVACFWAASLRDSSFNGPTIPRRIALPGMPCTVFRMNAMFYLPWEGCIQRR